MNHGANIQLHGGASFVQIPPNSTSKTHDSLHFRSHLSHLAETIKHQCYPQLNATSTSSVMMELCLSIFVVEEPWQQAQLYYMNVAILGVAALI